MSARASIFGRLLLAPLCGALSLLGVGCGDEDALKKGERTSNNEDPEHESDSDRAAPGTPARETGAPSGSAASGEDDTPTMTVDAQVLLDRDAGSQFVPTNSGPVTDAAVITIQSPALGRAYAESEFVLQEPSSLQTAFESVAQATGDTRLLVTEPYMGDAGSEVRYGAADLIDGGLIWQKPPAHPRSFALAASEANGKTVVSAPFKYILEARIALTAGNAFRLYLETEQAVFRATFNEDYTQIVAGELRGVLARDQLDHRPLDLVSCSLACGLNSLSFCSQSELHLAAVFDCNGQKPDVDTNDDGVLDGYRLVVSFKSREVAPPTE